MLKIVDVLESLRGVQGIEVSLNAPLKLLTTMRLNSVGHLVEVKNLQALLYVLETLSKHNCNYEVLGKGSNSLLKEFSEIPYLKLNFDYDQNILKQIGPTYILPASIPLSRLTSHAIDFGLKGWEVFTGIPASLGGAIYMNAGTNLGAIGSIVVQVWVVSSCGKLKNIKIEKNSFSYRRCHFLDKGDVIYQVELTHLGQDDSIPRLIREYLKKRKQTQPLDQATCGCMFMNDESRNIRAGQMIDLLGLKGLTVNGVVVSHVHSNFFEHRSQCAAYKDVIELMESVNREVYMNLGIEFGQEVRL